MSEGKSRGKPKRKLIKHWLKEKATADSNWSVAAAAGLALVGTFACVVVYGTMYVVFFFVFLDAANVAALGTVAALFVVNAFVSRETLEGVTEAERISSKGRQHYALKLSRRAGAIGSIGALGLHGLIDPRSFLRTVSSILLLGPRLFTESGRLLRKAARLRRLDVDGCGEAMATLMQHDSRDSFDELFEALAGRDGERIVEQLCDLEGVLPLSNEPPGLTLSSELKQEYRDWRTRRRAAE